MSWFLIAIIAPILWSIVNHADKYLLSKHSADSSVGSLMIFSTFAGIIVVVLAPFFAGSLAIPVAQAAVLILAGLMAAAGIMMYLYALEHEEASVVVPFMQLIPVFGYIFGYIILGETLTQNQIIASLIIILGAGILSFEFIEEGGVKLRKKVVILMSVNTAMYALHEVLFKAVAVDAGFVVSVFWGHLGLLIFGLVLYTGFRTYRRDFHRIINEKRGRASLLGINIGSEILTLTGNVVTNYALLLAPAALVLVVTGYQPVFVFIIGVLLTVFLPRFAEEQMSRKHILHKASAIAVILVGTYMMFA